MSPRTRITTLNLGSQSIELAEFRVQPSGGLILCGYRSRELLADSAREGTRRMQVIAALREMLGELQIKGGPVNYTVAEEAVFTRFVKLPSLGEEKMSGSLRSRRSRTFRFRSTKWFGIISSSGAV